jgi:hypothetical protein
LDQERADYSKGFPPPPPDLGGRETSPMTNRQVSWVEKARKKLQRQEDSRICDLATMREEAASQEVWVWSFVSVIEGEASEADWTTRLTPVTEGVSL